MGLEGSAPEVEELEMSVKKGENAGRDGVAGGWDKEGAGDAVVVGGAGEGWNRDSGTGGGEGRAEFLMEVAGEGIDLGTV